MITSKTKWEGVRTVKRISACCLALSLTLSLSSCSQPAGNTEGLPKLNPEEPVSLEIWHYYNGPQKTAFDAMVDEFNETVGLEQGIVVEAFGQGKVDELASKILDAAAKKVGAEDVPAIFAAYADTAYEMDRMGMLADLSPYLTQEELAKYRPEYIEEGDLSGDGSLKIFPIAKSVELLMLNQTDWQKFADATGATLSQLSTIEGITETAGRYYAWTDSLTPEPNDGKAFFGRDAMANYFIIGCRQLGVEIFQVENGVGVINADKTALRRLWDNYYVPFINGWFSANGRFRSDAAHMGDIIALVGSSSGALYFPAEVAVSDFESYPIVSTILPAPIFADSTPYAVQQGAGMAVTKSDPATEYAATIFLRWFTAPERNAVFAADSGYLPVETEALDMELLTSTTVVGDDPIKAERMRDIFAAALEQLEGCTLYTTKAFDGGNSARSVLEHSMSDLAAADRQAIQERIADGLSAEEAVAQYDTDAHFEAWYAQLVEDLNAAIQ